MNHWQKGIDVSKDSERVELIAKQLVDKLNNPVAYKYYCKVAINLTEAEIWNMFEIAARGRNPVRYFTFLSNKAMNDKDIV